MHPHTYVRLPNGHVLATFQYRGGHGPKAEGGGLVEVTPRGELIRSSSAMDPAAAAELIRPYSLVVMPALDRVVTTNTAMHEADGNGRTVQVWRLSDLKLLRTVALPAGPSGTEHQNPGELKLLADGRSVLVHTFSCGLYQLDGVETDRALGTASAYLQGHGMRRAAAPREVLGADPFDHPRARVVRPLGSDADPGSVAPHLR